MSAITLKHIHYTQLNSRTWCASAELIVLSEAVLWHHPIDSLKYSNQMKQIEQKLSASPSLMLDTLSWQRYYSKRSSRRSISVTPKSASAKRQQQRVGVRLLLEALLKQLNIVDKLDDSTYPYRLVNSGYYICFSHSGHSHLGSLDINSAAHNKRYDKVAVALSYSRSIGIDIEVQDVNWKLVQRYYHPTEAAILSALPVTQRQIISKLLWQIKECFIKINQHTLAAGLGVPYLSILDEFVIPNINELTYSMTVDTNYAGYQVTVLPHQQMVVVF